MTIRYVTAPADMGAFQSWWLQNTPEGQRAVQSTTFRLCLMVAFLCGLMAWLSPSLIPILTIEALIGIGAIMLLTPLRIRQNAATQAMRTYGTPENAVLFGQRTMEINADGILSISENATSLYKWESVVNISSTDTHAFLTIGTVMGIIIARDTVAEGNLDAFVAEARRLHRQAKEHVPIAAAMAR